MANKRSSSVKSSSKSTKSLKSRNLFGRLTLVHASNIVVAAFFVLGFAGFGTWYVNTSNAATSWSCAQHIYYEYETSGYCVKNIQIQLADNLWMNDQGLKTDGIFGPATKAAVIKYGYGKLGYNNNGVVGAGMWRSLCSQGLASSGELYYITYGGPTNDGCSVNASTYGKYYVGMAGVPAPNKKYASDTRSRYGFPITA